MKFLDSISSPLARVPGLKNRIVRIAVALLLLAIVVVLVITLAITVLPWLPLRFWQLLALCLVAFAVLWWFTAGARRFSRKGFARKRIGDLGPGNPDDEKLALERMRQGITLAKQAIQRSPEIGKGRDPLYRIPWMLFIGDQEADVPGLLKAANQSSPFPPPTEPAGDPDQVWRWWFFKSMIAIETHPRLVCDPGDRIERGLWYQALMLLATERDKLPLNGIVICIAAPTLLGGADAIRPIAMRLRRMVDEALEHLQVQLPVYLIVTGLEQLPGYATFAAALPPEALQQALGHRLPETEVISAATSGRLRELYAPIAERLHALRITALRGQVKAPGRRAVYEFVEHVRALGDGLEALVKLMLEDNPFQRTPRWRGLYLTGAPQTGPGGKQDAGGAFVADLFTRFLPADQPLASPSFKGNAGKFAIAAVGVAAMLGLSLTLSLGLSNARQDDGRLLAQTRVACQEPRDAGAASRIGWLARCGRTIEQLEVASAGTGLSFGLRQADSDIERLKSVVLRDFSNLILAPYDQAIETDLNRGQAGLEHVLAVAQRLRMLDHCRRQSDDCLKNELQNNVAFDHNARLFSPFVSGEKDARADREHAASLLTTYMGYLRWQQSATLDAEAHRLQALLKRILASYTPRPQDVRAWADARRDRTILTEFWLPPDRVVGVDTASLPVVSAAFTQALWRGTLAPMVRTASHEVPDRAGVLEDFRNNYFNEYFREWARFEARFFEGVALWHGQVDGLARRAATTDNPYVLLDARVRQDLLDLDLDLPLGTRWTLAWSQAKSDWLDSWRPLGRFVGDTTGALFTRMFGPAPVTPPAWLLAQMETTAGVLKPQAPIYTRGYLRLQADGGSQAIYDIAADLFRARGAATQPPAAEYAVLLQSVDRPNEKFAATFRGDDLAAWTVVQGPARLLLYLTVQRAAQVVQARWSDGVVAPLKGLSPRDQMEALYGEQGKLNAFVKDWLQPFVSERERVPIRVADVSLPLSKAYQGMVAAERKVLSAQGGKPFLAGSLQFSRPTQVGRLAEGPQGSLLEVVCRDKVYTASTRAESLTDATAQVFWSPEACMEARIHISVPDPRAVAEPAPAADATPAPAASAPPPGLRLTLIYPGAEGFVNLLSDFKSGSHLFRLSDFRTSYSQIQWQDVTARLQQIGFVDARVFIDVRTSDEMERFLAVRAAPSTLPTAIMD